MDPRFADLNPAEGYGPLRAIKTRSTPLFGAEVKPLTQCRNILHVKNFYEYVTDIS
jgi:hypothetical protein